MKDNSFMKTTCMWQRVREHEYTAAEIHDVHDVPNTVMKRRRKVNGISGVTCLHTLIQREAQPE